MTPERIKHFKRLHIQKHQDCDSHLTVGDFNSLLATLEEAQQTIARHIEAFDKIADEFCDDCNPRAERINEIIFPFLNLEDGVQP